MRGHIEVRKGKSGTTSYRLTVSGGERLSDGTYTRIRETISGTRAQADKRLREMIHEVETGEYQSRRSTQTVRDLAVIWLDDARMRSKVSGTPRTKTIEMYEWITSKYVIPLIGSQSLKTIRSIDINTYLVELSKKKRADGKDLSNRTVKHGQSVLNMILRHGVRIDLLRRNPSDAINTIQRRTPEVETISPGDAQKVFEELEKTTPIGAAAAKLALATGARRSEICALNWSDLGEDFRTISIHRAFVDTRQGPEIVETKTRKSRRNAAIAPPGIDAVKDWLELAQDDARKHGLVIDPGDPLFMTADGKRLQPQSLSRAWRRACERAGVKVKFHSLRHSFATAALEAGIPLTFVSNQLGHSSIAITADTYGHVAEGFGAQVADAVGGRFMAALSGGKQGENESIENM